MFNGDCGHDIMFNGVARDMMFNGDGNDDV